MTVSVFTPSHDPTWLYGCWRSLLAQTDPDWEWIVVLNGDADWAPPADDDRITVVHRRHLTGHVGALKAEACSLASGDILLELDHDDLLTDDCVETIARCFAQVDAVLVYSDWAQINADGSPNLERFNEAHGWTYRQQEDGLLVCSAMEPTPHNLAYIWYAPNHVRAFTREAYDKVDGYDTSLDVLDDQDLMARLYQVGPFYHVPECLYWQRVHDHNTQRHQPTNDAIQAGTVDRYWSTIGTLATTWAFRSGLEVLDVSPEWAGGVDPTYEVDMAEEGSVGVIRAREVLQRLEDPGAWLWQAWRALAPGGLLLATVPSTDGRGAWQDPTHRSWWNENSLWYLTAHDLRERTWPGNPMRWQTSRARTYWVGEGIAYMEANLIAVKGSGPRQGGPLL